MKKVECLQEVLKDVRGNALKDQTQKDIVVVDALINILGASQQGTGKDILRAMKVSEKLYAAPNNHLELEDAEFELLKTTVMEQGGRVYTTAPLAPLLRLLGESLD